MIDYKVRRYISVFRESDENLECEVDFEVEPSIEVLRKVFCVPENDPMYAEFPIDRRVGGLLEPFLGGLSFDFLIYSYFLSCSRV
jgi:hypothetical protein